jgi:hypothetical protein
MRYYRSHHRFYCGNGLHARTMHVGLPDHAGQVAAARGRGSGSRSSRRSAARLGRAVYPMLRKRAALDAARFRQGGRGVTGFSSLPAPEACHAGD